MSYPDLAGVGTYDWSSYGAYFSYNATETSSHNVANELVYSYLDSSNTTHNYPEHDIIVNTSTNTWSDHGSGDPTDFNTDSNGDIELEASNIVRFRFTPPAPSTWGGGGAGTLSTSTVKTLTQSGRTLVAFVGGGNASVSNLSIVDSAGLVPTNPGVSVWHTHTNGTDTEFTWPISESGTYRLMNLQTLYAEVTATIVQKKVFCNFW